VSNPSLDPPPSGSNPDAAQHRFLAFTGAQLPEPCQPSSSASVGGVRDDLQPQLLPCPYLRAGKPFVSAIPTCSMNTPG
jgi:hypothetical protein